MKKLILNICTVTITLTAFAQFGTAAAFAAELAPKSKQEIIRDAFAKYSLTLENAQGAVKALSEASVALKENNVSSNDLVQYALQDMNPAEAKGFLAKVQSIKGQNLSPEEIGQIMRGSENHGSNFLGCMMGRENGAGFMTALMSGIVAFSAGIVALTELSQKDPNIQTIELQKVQTQQDINILLQEGVSPNSYLVTSRRADLAVMTEKENQLRNNDNDAHKRGQIEAAVAAGALVLVLVNLDC